MKQETTKSRSGRLTYFCVENLFGFATNEIPIKNEGRITAIIGPNGRGKTICLRLIHAFYTRRYNVFLDVDFSQIEMQFESDIKVIIKK